MLRAMSKSGIAFDCDKRQETDVVRTERLTDDRRDEHAYILAHHHPHCHHTSPHLIHPTSTHPTLPSHQYYIRYPPMTDERMVVACMRGKTKERAYHHGGLAIASERMRGGGAQGDRGDAERESLEASDGQRWAGQWPDTDTYIDRDRDSQSQRCRRMLSHSAGSSS